MQWKCHWQTRQCLCMQWKCHCQTRQCLCCACCGNVTDKLDRVCAVHAVYTPCHWQTRHCLCCACHGNVTDKLDTVRDGNVTDKLDTVCDVRVVWMPCRDLRLLLQHCTDLSHLSLYKWSLLGHHVLHTEKISQMCQWMQQGYIYKGQFHCCLILMCTHTQKYACIHKHMGACTNMCVCVCVHVTLT